MAEQQIEPCPLCKGECDADYESYGMTVFIHCAKPGCSYAFGLNESKANTIAAHNKLSINNAIAEDLIQSEEIRWDEAEHDWYVVSSGVRIRQTAFIRNLAKGGF